MNNQEINFEVKEKILRLTSLDNHVHWLQLLIDRRATQVFLDTQDEHREPQRLITEVSELRTLIGDDLGLLEPIVVGPIGKLQPEVASVFAQLRIRTAGMTYDTYCEHLRKNRERPNT